MPAHHGYPAARERMEPGATPGLSHYARWQSTGGFVTLGDTFADVIAFAGTPDAIEVTVETFDAVVALTDRVRRDEDTITLRAGQAWDTKLRASVVRARNATAGSNARVQVVGKWLRR